MAQEQTPSNKLNPSPKQQRRADQLSSPQVMFAAILAIGLMLAINFSNRIAADRSLKEVHDKIVQEIDLLKREQGDLINELNYVKSDAFVSAWAHSEGKMVREGEILVVPKPPDNPVQASETVDPLPLVASETSLPEPDPWALWWALFFDSEPPQF